MQGLAMTGRNTSTSNIMTMTNSDARRFLYIDIRVQKCSSLSLALKRDSRADTVTDTSQALPPFLVRRTNRQRSYTKRLVILQCWWPC